MTDRGDDYQRGDIAGGLYAIADALRHVAKAINRLGNADASTPMGALEALGAVHKEAANELARVLEHGLADIAQARLEESER
jgi:hypothetical protein